MKGRARSRLKLLARSAWVWPTACDLEPCCLAISLMSSRGLNRAPGLEHRSEVLLKEWLFGRTDVRRNRMARSDTHASTTTTLDATLSSSSAILIFGDLNGTSGIPYCGIACAVLCFCDHAANRLQFWMRVDPVGWSSTPQVAR